MAFAFFWGLLPETCFFSLQAVQGDGQWRGYCLRWPTGPRGASEAKQLPRDDKCIRPSWSKAWPSDLQQEEHLKKPTSHRVTPTQIFFHGHRADMWQGKRARNSKWVRAVFKYSFCSLLTVLFNISRAQLIYLWNYNAFLLGFFGRQKCLNRNKVPLSIPQVWVSFSFLLRDTPVSHQEFYLQVSPVAGLQKHMLKKRGKHQANIITKVSWEGGLNNWEFSALLPHRLDEPLS